MVAKLLAAGFGVVLAIACPLESRAGPKVTLSHSALREQPPIANRPMGAGLSHFVDAKAGRDSNPGTEARPWSTINHALKQLQHEQHQQYLQHLKS